MVEWFLPGFLAWTQRFEILLMLASFWALAWAVEYFDSSCAKGSVLSHVWFLLFLIVIRRQTSNTWFSQSYTKYMNSYVGYMVLLTSLNNDDLTCQQAPHCTFLLPACSNNNHGSQELQILLLSRTMHDLPVERESLFPASEYSTGMSIVEY